MKTLLPDDWQAILEKQLDQEHLLALQGKIAKERQNHIVFPPEEQTFAAFKATSFESLRVVILGQDPYHDDGQAHGLAFSVNRGKKIPPSLRNIFKELESDLGTDPPEHGDLSEWAKQGVLLLNTVLTVQAHQANSHRGMGWERFTDSVIQMISNRKKHVVFVLWGKPAEKKTALIDASRHSLIISPHPSPLSAHRGFFGSRPFSRTNDALKSHGQQPVDWR